MATTSDASGWHPGPRSAVDVMRPDGSVERVSVPDDPAEFAAWMAALPRDAVLSFAPGADEGDDDGSEHDEGDDGGSDDGGSDDGGGGDVARAVRWVNLAVVALTRARANAAAAVGRPMRPGVATSAARALGVLRAEEPFALDALAELGDVSPDALQRLAAAARFGRPDDELAALASIARQGDDDGSAYAGPPLDDNPDIPW